MDLPVIDNLLMQINNFKSLLEFKKQEIIILEQKIAELEAKRSNDNNQ